MTWTVSYQPVGIWIRIWELQCGGPSNESAKSQKPQNKDSLLLKSNMGQNINPKFCRPYPVMVMMVMSSYKSNTFKQDFKQFTTMQPTTSTVQMVNVAYELLIPLSLYDIASVPLVNYIWQTVWSSIILSQCYKWSTTIPISLLDGSMKVYVCVCMCKAGAGGRGVVDQ